MATIESVKQDLNPEVVRHSPRVTMRDAIERQRDEIAKALPNTMTAERFIRLVLTECSRTPKLYACTIESLLGASMVASQLGLEPGGGLGHCYLIPRVNRKKGVTEAQFLLGYKGMIDLARRSGDIASIEAHAVYDADEFDFEQGSRSFVRWRKSLSDGRGAAVAYFAIVKFRGGGEQFDVLSVAEICRHRDQYADVGDFSPWVTAFDQMARKTVIRQMAPYLPLTPLAARAVAFDGGVTTQLGDLDEIEAEFDHDSVVREDEAAASGGGPPEAPAPGGDPPPDAAGASERDGGTALTVPPSRLHDLDRFTRGELRGMLDERGIEAPAGAIKSDLVALLAAAEPFEESP